MLCALNHCYFDVASRFMFDLIIFEVNILMKIKSHLFYISAGLYRLCYFVMLVDEFSFFQYLFFQF